MVRDLFHAALFAWFDQFAWLRIENPLVTVPLKRELFKRTRLMAVSRCYFGLSEYWHENGTIYRTVFAMGKPILQHRSHHSTWWLDMTQRDVVEHIVIYLK